MRPLILAPGVAAPAAALAVDGDPIGAAAYLSHWPGTPEPPLQFAADTATGMTVRAAATGWLAQFPVVCNNHLDADGVLAMLVCCRPELASSHGQLLEAAAEAGDFTAWLGPRPQRLMLAVHQLLRTYAGQDQAAIMAVIAGADELLAAADQADPERDAQISQIERAILIAPEQIRLGQERLAVIRWTRRIGHAWDGFGQVYQPDDLPLAAIAACVPQEHFQLLVEETAHGPVIVCAAPGHSWARTVSRPRIAWPDCTALAAELQRGEQGPGRWVAGAPARKVGFTTILATVDADFLPVATSHDPAVVQALIRSALAT